MALDWTDIYSEITAQYPTAFGDSGQDTTLALACVKFANSLFNTIDTERRWSLAYQSVPQATTPGTSQYAIPTGMTAISHLYWLQATAGAPVTMENFDIQELRRMFGDGSAALQGPPRYYAVIGSNIQVFPTPDANGPSSGNYPLVFEGYQRLVPITQTTGRTASASPTLTVPSTGYLTARGVATSGTYLSVMGSGYAGPASVADTLFTTWSAFPLSTTVTMGANAQVTNNTDVKVFFNSSNWVIQNFDHVVLFGVLREVAAYLKENFQTWDQRFQLAMTNMAQEDVDRRKDMELQGVAVTGQNQPELLGRRDTWYGNGGWW